MISRAWFDGDRGITETPVQLEGERKRKPFETELVIKATTSLKDRIKKPEDGTRNRRQERSSLGNEFLLVWLYAQECDGKGERFKRA